MTPPDTQASQSAWHEYWRSGALHSCATSFAANYDGAIAAFWLRNFAGLGPQDRVLDIASGNGALARLLLDTDGNANVPIDSVDLAPVAPAWQDELAAGQKHRLAFFGHTAAEALPFSAASHTLAVSQYGLEYTDLDRSVPELLRVLRRPARVALLVHHTASRPVTLARDEVAHIDWLLGPDGLLITGTALLEPMARAATPAGRQKLAADNHAIRLRDQFNALQLQLEARASAAPCPDVLYDTREVIAASFATAARQGVGPAAQRLQALRELLVHSRVRLADLLRCALDERGVAGLVQRFGSVDPPRVGKVVEQNWLMGWTVELQLGPVSE